jgi:hypothetical protein
MELFFSCLFGGMRFYFFPARQINENGAVLADTNSIIFLACFL